MNSLPAQFVRIPRVAAFRWSDHSQFLSALVAVNGEAMPRPLWIEISRLKDGTL